MTAQTLFSRATKAERGGGWVFWTVLLLSLVALIFPKPEVQDVVNPLLIAACITGVVLSILGTIWQNEGNHLLRATQLADALGVPIGTTPRADYYNNQLPPSTDRLVATTFENSVFSSAVLQAMLVKERIIVAVYVLVFVLLTTSRWTSTSSLLLLAQTVFSVDVVVHWLRMERFHCRVNRVRDQLHQFFFQGGTAGDKAGLAIALAAFSNYECAKDEAAMPLESKVFQKLNPKVTVEWEALRKSLKIP